MRRLEASSVNIDYIFRNIHAYHSLPHPRTCKHSLDHYILRFCECCFKMLYYIARESFAAADKFIRLICVSGGNLNQIIYLHIN